MNGKAVITLPKGGQFVTREISFTFSKDRGRENNAINLYPEITYQSLDGFGGSATEAAGYVLSQLDDARREEALRAYFGRDGLRYSWLRSSPWTAVTFPFPATALSPIPMTGSFKPSL